MARGSGCQIRSCGKALDGITEGIVRFGEPEKDLVRLFLILKVRRLERLNIIKIKVAWRNCCGTLIGRAKKEVSLARSLTLQPLQLVLPDLVTSYIGLVSTLHDSFKGLVVVAI